MKKIMMIILVCISILLDTTAFATNIQKDINIFYPKLTVVFEIEKVEDFWIIYCIDKSQNVWSFYDDEGTWEPGDIANLLLWHTNEHEEDDEIIEVYWEGYTENLKFFFDVTDWRQ